MAEDIKYEFEAPQFVNFQERDDHGIDTWFDASAGDPPTAESMLPTEADFESGLTIAMCEGDASLSQGYGQPQVADFPEGFDDGAVGAEAEDEAAEPWTVPADENAAPAVPLGAAQLEQQQIAAAAATDVDVAADADVAATAAAASEPECAAEPAETAAEPTQRRKSPHPSAAAFLKPTAAVAAKAKRPASAPKPTTAPKASAPPRLTVPVTPAFARRATAAAAAAPKRAAMTSEERELLEIEAAKAEARKRLERNKLLAARGATAKPPAQQYRPARSAKPLTEPQEFSFRSDARLRAPATAAPAAAEPKPAARPASASGARALTIPVTPGFVRAHPPKSGPAPKTSEELELEAIAAHPRFRARPVSARILESNGDLGVPKVPKAKPTECAEPAFTGGARLAARKAAREQAAAEAAALAAKAAEFKARPVPRSVYEAPSQPVLSASARPATVAASPALATKRRAAMRPEPAAPAEPRPTPFKAQPLPVFATPSLPKKAAAAITVPEPFNLSVDERGSRYRQRLDESVSSQLDAEAKAHQFRANPLPDLTIPDALPEVACKPTTVPEPFPLASAARHDVAVARFQSEVEREMADVEAMFSSFTAKKFVEKLPFVPTKSTKPLTELNEFTLNTSARSEKRASYDAAKIAEHERMAAERAEQEAARAAQEAADLREYRKSLDFKAHGIQRYKSVEPAAALPLTEPRSPNFQTSERSRVM